ncbi:MAG: SDR family oxidoreductase [Parasphingorhabdus sp.]
MSLTIDFTGKVAIVTGASGGIGAATARLFHKIGANLILTDRSEEVQNLAEELGDRAVAFQCDVTDKAAHEEMAESALSQFGRLDFAFNNAGIGGKLANLPQTDLENWDQVVDVNLNAVAYGMKHQAGAMLKSGGGVIINNSSVMGLKPIPDQTVSYAASKHGVIGLTKQAACNHGKDNIRVNAICPGLIETPLVSDGKAGKEDDFFVQKTALRRNGRPEEIATVVAFLCSEHSSFITGAALPVDGGFILS